MQPVPSPVVPSGTAPGLRADARSELLRAGRARSVSWHTAGVLVLLVLATWFRFAHLSRASLTHDEAWRANVCYGVDPVLTPRRLPPLQFLIGRAVQSAFGRTELAVRMPYALSGLACVGVVYLFARRHLDRHAAWLAAAVATCHPILITTSRQAKVFAFETLLATVLLWAGLEAYRHRSRRHLGAFAALSILGLATTFTSSLLTAAWLPLIGFSVYRDRAAAASIKRWFVAVTLLIALAGAGWYLWLSGSPVGDIAARSDGWADAWPASYAPGVLGRWLIAKSVGMASYGLGTTPVWAPLKWCVGTAGALALAAAIGPCWRRPRVLCAFGGVLALELSLVGALGLWPIGELRTVTFVVPLFALAVGCGLAEFARGMGRSAVTAALVGLCLIVPAARAAKATLFPPPLAQHTRPVFEYAASRIQPGDAVFMHYEMLDAGRFYWDRADHPTLFQPHADRDTLSAFADRFDAWIADHPRVWFFFMLRRPAEAGPWLDHLREHHRVADHFRVNDAGVYLIERRASGATKPRRGETG